MQCNIDARGKALRLISGSITLIVALILVMVPLVANLTPAWPWYVAALGTAVGGTFQVYEGWAGWCAVRAMGFKTPF